MNGVGLGLRLIAALLAFALAAPAAAAGLDGVLAWQSDKVVRGLSQSGGDAVGVADLHWQGDSGWALNAGLSTLGNDRRRGDAELLVGVGRGAAWNEDLSWQFGASRYDTLGRGSNRRASYGEASASLDWRGRLQATVMVAPRYPGTLVGGGVGRGRGLFIEASAHQPLVYGLALDAGLGRTIYQGLAFRDYTYGSLGLSWARGPLQLVISRVHSNSASTNRARPRALFSVLWSL